MIRYEVYVEHNGQAAMQPSEQGDYVAYAEYATIKARLVEAETLLAAALPSVRLEHRRSAGTWGRVLARLITRINTFSPKRATDMAPSSKIDSSAECHHHQGHYQSNFPAKPEADLDLDAIRERDAAWPAAAQWPETDSPRLRCVVLDRRELLALVDQQREALNAACAPSPTAKARPKSKVKAWDNGSKRNTSMNFDERLAQLPPWRARPTASTPVLSDVLFKAENYDAAMARLELVQSLMAAGDRRLQGHCVDCDLVHFCGSHQTCTCGRTALQTALESPK